MEKLTIADQNGLFPIILHGSTAAPPVIGAVRQAVPQPAGNGLVEEVIDLALKGAGISAVLQSLEEKILLSQQGIREAYLYLQTAAGLSAISARILSGRIELLGGGLNDRKRHVQILRLRLVRADYWEESTRALALSNQNGSQVWNGLAIRNHCDATAGHQNFVDIDADEVHGTLPCPVQVRLILPEGFPAALRDCHIAAGFDLKDEYSAFDHVLEGEAGAPGSGCTGSSQETSSSCSAGASVQVEWTAQSEVPLWKWTLSADQLGYMGACNFRPVMRLAALPAEGVYLRWSASTQSGGEMLRTQQTLLDPGKLLTPLPALRLPPAPMDGGPYRPLEIQLRAECAEPGVKSLNIDFVHLLPAASYQHLHPLGQLEAGYTLVSDGREERVYACQSGGNNQQISHLLTGAPIVLQPGRHNRVFFLYETASGTPIEALTQVMIYQKARIQQP